MVGCCHDSYITILILIFIKIIDISELIKVARFSSRRLRFKAIKALILHQRIVNTALC